MKINNLIYIVLLGIIVSLTSCEDDDSLFSGNENYITSFRLVQQGDSYAGIIKGDSLILSIPENLSLGTGVRGLKSPPNTRPRPRYSVAPHWGAWIEIRVSCAKKTGL